MFGAFDPLGIFLMVSNLLGNDLDDLDALDSLGMPLMYVDPLGIFLPFLYLLLNNSFALLTFWELLGDFFFAKLHVV